MKKPPPGASGKAKKKGKTEPPEPAKTKGPVKKSSASEPTSSATPVRTIAPIFVDRIQPDPNQPRRVNWAAPNGGHGDLSDITSTLVVKDGVAVTVGGVRHGIRQPIRVRKTPAHLPAKWPWTILTGERRWRSAREAGLVEVDCEIVEINEADVLPEQLQENLARRDLPMLDIADSLAVIVEKNRKSRRLSMEDLARSVGLPSARQAHRYLVLARLAPEVRKALQEEKIGMMVALDIATIEKPEAQVEALSVVEHLDARAARRAITSRYHLDLVETRCGFSPADATLPGGSCEACPKNTASQRKLWADSEDMDGRCTDRACFATKKEESAQRKLQAAAASGAKVMTVDEVKKILPSPYSDPRASGLIDLDEVCEHDDLLGEEEADKPLGQKTWREVLGASPEISAITHVGQVSDGSIRELVPMRDVAAKLQERGQDATAAALLAEADDLEDFEEEETSDTKVSNREVAAKAKSEYALEQATRNFERPAAMKAIAAAAAKHEYSFALWRFLAVLLLHGAAGHDAFEELEELSERLGVEVPEASLPLEVLLDHVRSDERTEADVRAIVFEIAVGLARPRYKHEDESGLALASRFFGVDLESIHAQAVEQARIKLGLKAAPAEPEPQARAISTSAAAEPSTCRVCHCTSEEPCESDDDGTCVWAGKDETLCSFCAYARDRALQHIEKAGAAGINSTQVVQGLEDEDEGEAKEPPQDWDRIVNDLVEQGDLVGLGGDGGLLLFTRDMSPIGETSPVERQIVAACKVGRRTRKQILAACKGFTPASVNETINRLVTSKKLAADGGGLARTFVSA